jgi:predicted NBD/HSP70 family sugar kinase
MFSSNSTYSSIQKNRMRSILKAILDHKRVTRNKLANLLGLSLSSIVKYVKLLIEQGFIRETGEEVSTGGRRSILLELNPDAGVNIAIILNMSSIRAVLIDILGQEIASYSAPAYQGIPKDELLHTLYTCIDTLLEKAVQKGKRVFGIGIGLGGFIDPIKGISHEYLYANGWYDVPLRKLVEEKYNYPCFLVNDANACALMEKYYGMGMGIDHFLCLQLAEGVGMGIVVNGEIYMGNNYYAGELGHTHISDTGQLCYCGHTGCLETETSKQYIIDTCKEGIEKGVHSEILKHCNHNPEELTIEHIIEAANNGDRLARNVFNQVGKNIGYKLADVANIFNPERIILRGETIDGNEVLYETIKREIKDLTLRPISSSIQVLYSKEREDIRFKGIGSYIFINYFYQE